MGIHHVEDNDAFDAEQGVPQRHSCGNAALLSRLVIDQGEIRCLYAHALSETWP